jgi:hypothetical protein
MEQSTVRFYKYQLEHFDKGITITAKNRYTARQKLVEIVNKLYKGKEVPKVISEIVEEPIVGVSTKRMNGKTYIWVGDKTKDGWKLKE